METRPEKALGRVDVYWISGPFLLYKMSAGWFPETALERAGWPEEKLTEAKASWLVIVDSCDPKTKRGDLQI